MSILSFFTGGKAVAEPVEAVGGIIDNLFTSDEERLDKENVKLRLQQKPALVQAEINKIQAQHRSTFVAGGRPFLLWVCGFGFLQAFIINPNVVWIAALLGHDLTAPELELSIMMELTLAMLGLSGLRTIEKIKGVSK